MIRLDLVTVLFFFFQPPPETCINPVLLLPTTREVLRLFGRSEVVRVGNLTVVGSLRMMPLRMKKFTSCCEFMLQFPSWFNRPTLENLEIHTGSCQFQLQSQIDGWVVSKSSCCSWVGIVCGYGRHNALEDDDVVSGGCL
ncbi:hypothetical protein Hanom_Chr10g00946691 [Helianthus anomalus]